MTEQAKPTSQTLAKAEPVETPQQRIARRRSNLQAGAVEALLVRGLYSRVRVDSEFGNAIENDMASCSSISVDCFCITCRQQTPFRMQSKDVYTRSIAPGISPSQRRPETLYGVRTVCQRCYGFYTYVFEQDGESLIKIGQHPSMADISFGELRSIDKSLDEVDRRELGKALGLFAHDTALGAFVYLRRVFERMVNRAYERQCDAGNPVEGFAAMKMQERIAALKNELPEKVVQSSAVFSVLSVGIHELTEEQCAEFFPVLKAVLFQMLEQEEHKRKAAITERETDAALQTILSKLAKDDHTDDSGKVAK